MPLWLNVQGSFARTVHEKWHGSVDVSAAHAGAKDLVAVLVLRRDLFQDHCRVIEHSQFKIAARCKDMPLPIGFQGTGGYWRRNNRVFVATQVTSRKPPAVTANMMSDQK